MISWISSKTKGQQKEKTDNAKKLQSWKRNNKQCNSITHRLWKIFSNHVSVKKLMYKIYEETKPLNSMKTMGKMKDAIKFFFSENKEYNASRNVRQSHHIKR